ncbi:hypothetical protein CBS101457_006465 [Exobasidium rhododendri]|nr:hypothetical protein CBS101457_006465 [Exobasidium rhododendri]
MPGTTISSAALAVASKYEEISARHIDCIKEVEELRDAAVDDVLPAVLQELGLSEDAQAIKVSMQFLDDPSTLFRFYRRSRYSTQNALSLLTSTLTWRLRTDLDSLSLSSLHPLYASPPARPPLFWGNTSCMDKLGRPIGVISLGSLERAVKEDGTTGLDECREYIVGCMESERRYLSHLYAKGSVNSASSTSDGRPLNESKPIQIVIIFSLQSSGMANLELELLPFLLDLLKNHFPGMIGAVYIVHYGWVHSGMWALAKRVLPRQALAKIFFPNTKELPDHFDLSHLPSSLGGEYDIALNDETNDVMKKFARPGLQGASYSVKAGSARDDSGERESHSAPSSPRGMSGASSPAVGRSSRAMSRSGSFDSLVEEFYSTANTPWHITPRASQTPTPHSELASYPHVSSQSASSSSSMLQMTPKAVRKLHQIQMTRGMSGNRSRAGSDVNRRVTTDDVTSFTPGQSPVLSRGSSPSRTRRRPQAITTLQGAKNVHFQSEEPLSRKGSLRDFRLLQGKFAMSELAAQEENSSSEESDKSGKVGEMKENGDDATGTGNAFFARWRQSFPLQANAVSDQKRKKENAISRRVESSQDEDSLVEIEPEHLLSPRLQVSDIEEPPISGFETLSEASVLLSRRTTKFNALPGHVSPYNASNPFYGYPAFPVMNGPHIIKRKSSVYGPSTNDQDAQRLLFRKRKRDLMRTLMYLFVLRLLSMHRGVRNQALTAYRGFVRALRAGGESENEDPQEEEWREANIRYKKLRLASTRNDDGSYAPWNQGEGAAGQKHKVRQAQPLAQLGFRKRYAFFILFLFIVARRDWRNRLFINVKNVLALAGMGKLHVDDVKHGKKPHLHSNTSALKLEDRSSLTGLHLRRRLGWKG